MNERIKELAEQAEMEWDTHIWCWLANPPHLERFAELVRQDEREAIAALVEADGRVHPKAPDAIWAKTVAKLIRARGNDLIREELAKPEQEPVELQSIEQYRMQMAAICTAAIGYWKESDNIHPDYDSLALRDVAKLYAKYAELYTSPPRKEWVGLTQAEINRSISNLLEDDTDPLMTLAYVIEKKLKEKNT